MAEANRKIGSIDCPVCGENMPVRQNGRDTLNSSCPWCGASSYAKGGSDAHRIVSGWLRPDAAGSAAPVAQPVPEIKKELDTRPVVFPVLAQIIKPAFKQPDAMPWEL